MSKMSSPSGPCTERLMVTTSLLPSHLLRARVSQPIGPGIECSDPSSLYAVVTIALFDPVFVSITISPGDSRMVIRVAMLMPVIGRRDRAFVASWSKVQDPLRPGAILCALKNAGAARTTKNMNSFRTIHLLITGLILFQSSGIAQDSRRTESSPTPFTVQRTPWGDPDLQGDYTNKYEQGTPFERPAEFDGRRLEDVKGEELAELIKERGTQVILNAPFSGDPLAGNFGGAPAFYDQFEAHKGSRPWFVIDPPDGKIPALTASARERQAARQKTRAQARRGRGPSDSYTDHSLFDRCMTRGLPGSMMPTNYGNSYTIVQAPGVVAIRYEMIHETRIIPLDNRP